MTFSNINNIGPAYRAGLRRLQDPSTGALVHLSGRGTTMSHDYSWLGSSAQARALRKQALARGEPWPFVLVSRNLLDQVDE